MRIDVIQGVFHCLSCGYKGNIFKLFGETPNRVQQLRDRLGDTIKFRKAESIGLQIPKDSSPYIGTWRNISRETYKDFEAFENPQSDFSGRIVFPIRDATGKIRVFVGRHTSGGVPKYLNVPANARMPLFPTVEPYKGTIILVEGLFDVLNLYDKGVTHVMCCFGVGNVTEDKLNILRMRGLDKLIIFFDGDKAGQEGAAKVKNLCKRIGLNHTNIYLENKDPGELTESQVVKLVRKLY
jgi:DNA primase